MTQITVSGRGDKELFSFFYEGADDERAMIRLLTCHMLFPPSCHVTIFDRTGFHTFEGEPDKYRVMVRTGMDRIPVDDFIVRTTPEDALKLANGLNDYGVLRYEYGLVEITIK